FAFSFSFAFLFAFLFEPEREPEPEPELRTRTRTLNPEPGTRNPEPGRVSLKIDQQLDDGFSCDRIDEARCNLGQRLEDEAPLPETRMRHDHVRLAQHEIAE